MRKTYIKTKGKKLLSSGFVCIHGAPMLENVLIEAVNINFRAELCAVLYPSCHE